MEREYTKTEKVASKKMNWSRNEIGEIVFIFEQSKQSQRQFSRDKFIPQSTLQHWLSKKKSIDCEPSLVSFFESPIGMAFLHRLVTSAHFAFTKDGVASIHNISTFLNLSGLSAFVGWSYSSNQKVSKEMDNLIIEFEKRVKPELAKNMPTKIMTLAEDETFHPEVCVVSMEPVSNYIVVEKYVDNRKAETWNEVVLEGLKDIPVKVIQVTSDEGKGLIKHTTNGLNAHHSPDCFHVSYEIGKGTSGALASSVRKAEKEYVSMIKETENEINKEENYNNLNKRTIDCHPDFSTRIKTSKNKENIAKLKWEKSKQNQEMVLTSRREIGKIYHPYNPETGTKQDSEKISELLESCFENIRSATTGLSEQCKQKVEKAYRVVPDMVATIAFYFIMIDVFMDNMKISPFDKLLMKAYLIPAFYLQQVASKEKDVQRKSDILKISQELLTIINSRDGPFFEYTQKEVEKLEKAAKECAQIFQISSSCVEGRNAQLSLRHHGIHKLSTHSLKAQTIMHNYYRRTKDGKTPAEKFFEGKHPDLFQWILENIDYPVRPRKHLSKVA